MRNVDKQDKLLLKKQNRGKLGRDQEWREDIASQCVCVDALLCQFSGFTFTLAWSLL